MQKPVLGIHHVAIHAADFDQTVSFYREIFGFSPYIAWGEPGNRAVMLDTGDGSRIEVFENGSKDQPEGAWCHLALRVSDCDAVFNAAVGAGCRIQMEPQNVVIHGEFDLPVRIAFVYGLNGEIFEFMQEL